MLFSFFVGFLFFALTFWPIKLDFMHCSFDKYDEVNLLSMIVRFNFIGLLKLKLQNRIPLDTRERYRKGKERNRERKVN